MSVLQLSVVPLDVYVACIAPGRVCSTANCAALDIFVLRQPALLLDVFVLRQPDLLLDVSFLQQSMLPCMCMFYNSLRCP
jgi:hypothetical protein